MSTQFSLDLRVARRRAGFTQGDIAHLLGAHQSLVSDLERGRVEPTLVQIVTLSLIFGRSFESHFASVMREARRDLLTRVRSLPEDAREYVGTHNRASSIERLRDRLESDAEAYGDA